MLKGPVLIIPSSRGLPEQVQQSYNRSKNMFANKVLTQKGKKQMLMINVIMIAIKYQNARPNIISYNLTTNMCSYLIEYPVNYTYNSGANGVKKPKFVKRHL